MKKIFIILAILFTAFLIWGLVLNLVEGPEITEVLPANPLVVIHLQDIEKNFTQIASTPIWKTVSSIDWDSLSKKSSDSERTTSLVKWLSEEFLNPSGSSVVKRFFNKEAALVVYPPKLDYEQLSKKFTPQMADQFTREALSNVLLVTRVGADVQMAELAARFLKLETTDLSTQTSQYNGETIYTVSSAKAKTPVSFVRIKNLLVAGIDEGAIKASIDAWSNQQTSLRSDSQYSDVTGKFLRNTAFSSYVNLKGFFSFLDKEIDRFIATVEQKTGQVEESSKVKEQYNQFFKGIRGFESIGVTMRVGSPYEGQILWSYNPADMDPALAKNLTACTNGENKTLDFIPKSAIAYQWQSCIDLKSYWQQMQDDITANQGSARTQGMQAQINAVEQSWGLSIENDVLPAIGQEIGGYLKDINATGMFPSPQLVFFIRIADQLKAEHILSQLQNQRMFQIQEEEYSGTQIKYINLPLGATFQPGYCFLGDYFLLAVDRNLLHESIDAYKNKNSALAVNKDFQSGPTELGKKSTAVYYYKIDELSAKLKDVVKWGSDWNIARENKEQAFKEGTQKRLDDVRAEIKNGEDQKQDMQLQVNYLNEGIQKYQASGMPVEKKMKDLEDLKQKVITTDTQINSLKEQETQLQAMLQGYDTHTTGDPQMQERYLNEVINPILDSLQSIDAVGAVTTADKNSFETKIFLRMK